MVGLGELFGESVDDVARAPRPALVPLALDLATFGLAAVLLTLVLRTPALAADPRGYGLFHFGVPRGLPSLSDVLAPLAPEALVPAEGFLAAAAALFLVLPLAAYLEGGFIAWLDLLPDLPPAPERRRVFREAARRAFWPLLAFRALILALTLGAATVAARVPGWEDVDVLVLLAEFLLIFAPYVVVIERVGVAQALRRSAATFSDAPATCLGMLLFILLATAAALAFLEPVIRLVGLPGGLAFGFLLYAPIGTVLSLFVLRVYRGLHPEESEPEPLDAPVVTETARPKDVKWGVEGAPPEAR